MDVVHLQDKKYTITYHNGIMQFYRHGEEWPAGNELRYTNVVAALVQRVVELEEAADLAKNFFDLDKLSYDMIREAYDEAFGPHDPNITGNEIDYHIKELIKDAAKIDRELGIQQASEMNENMASYGTIDKPICKLIENAGNDGVSATSVQPKTHLHLPDTHWINSHPMQQSAASLVRAGWGHCNCDPNKSKHCAGFCEAPTGETATQSDSGRDAALLMPEDITKDDALWRAGIKAFRKALNEMTGQDGYVVKQTYFALRSHIVAAHTANVAQGNWPDDFQQVIEGAEKTAHELGHAAGIEEATKICESQVFSDGDTRAKAVAKGCAAAIRTLNEKGGA